MRVLLAHNIYRHEGGEERAVQQLKETLMSRHHTVELFQRDSRDWEKLSLVGKAALAVQLPYSFSSKKGIAALIKDFAPDILHVHNVFPFLSPSIYDAARENNVPVVQTLHNYRLFCMNGLLFRDGHPCELCVDGSAWNGFVHSCYQDSSLNSVAMAATLGSHRILNTWNRKIDKTIVLSDFSRRMYERAGFSADAMQVLPNPIEESAKAPASSNLSFLFMGRLSQEKGLTTLLEAFRMFCSDQPEAVLNVAGNGPLMDSLRKFQQSHPQLKVNILGFVSGSEKERLFSEASAVVFPSDCYENCPYGLLEPLSHGIPVIGSRRGAIPEIIKEGETGWLFEAGSTEDLLSCLNKAAKQPLEKQATMREAAWQDARRRFSTDQWIKEIENLYDSVSVRKKHDNNINSH